MSNSTVTVEVVGGRALRDALRSLPTKVRNNVVRKAIRTALKPVLTTARANVPRDTGELARSLVIRAVKGKNRSKEEIAFQVITDPSRFQGVPHAAAVEFGTSEVHAQPFMAQTFAQTATLAMAVCTEEIASGVHRITASL